MTPYAKSRHLSCMLARAGGIQFERTDGEHSRAAKLTWAKVRAIRRSRKTPAELATKYGVSVGTIHDVIALRRWREKGKEAGK